MKGGKWLSVLYVITFSFILAGSTFAYFALENGSTEGALGSKAAVVGINLYLTPKYTEENLIPMDNADVFTAYKHDCLDINNYGACQAYVIDIENRGETLDYDGTIRFTKDNIEHLNYLVLDGSILDVDATTLADDNFDFTDYVYKDITNVDTTTDQSMGTTFTLPEDGSKTFVLIIWVPNFESNQFEVDGAGTFGAIVTYQSTGNYQISGSISGS